MFYLTFDDVARVILAVFVGGLIGMEREYRDKAAGFRTLIFICLGSTLFTIFSVKFAGDKEPTRIAANIVSGVGFLGAGVILREGRRVIGLTTASMIWLTAALGMGIGGGALPLVGVALAASLVTLWFFPWFEIWLDNRSKASNYRIVTAVDVDKVAAIGAVLRNHHLTVHEVKHTRVQHEMVCTYLVSGSPQAHEAFRALMLSDEQVREFEY